MPITTTPSGGPQGEFSTYTPLYSQTLSATTASITFSNIPTTYTDLVLVINSKSTASDDIYLQFNSDTSSNYSSTWVRGSGSAAASSRVTNSTGMRLSDYSSPNSTDEITSIIQIMNYGNTTINKTTLARSNRASGGLEAVSGLWRSTSAITSIKAYPNAASWASGGTFTLYGIKAATAQFIPVNAAGGDLVTSDGTYAYHTFYTSGTFAPAKNLSCDVLMVAGGGGGGCYVGGGGGGGGYRAFSALSTTAGTSYPIVIGAGAPGQLDFEAVTRGSDTTAFSYTATGGGSGDSNGDGKTGGSGGGGRGAGGSTKLGGAGNTPSTSPSQGNNGGAGQSGGNVNASGAGGGGGAFAAGSAGGNSGGGAGGAGTSWLNGTTYAGGGGGGAYTAGVSSTAAAGGAGGGGTAGNPSSGANNNGTPGAANTGGGGGGASGTGDTAYPDGGNGGSGIVIVRYALNA